MSGRRVSRPQAAGPVSDFRALPKQGVSLLRGAGLEVIASLAVLAAAIAAPPLIRMSAFGARSDIPKHAAMAAEVVQSGGWFSYSTWYTIVDATARGSSDPLLLTRISIVYLLCAVVAKVVLVYLVGWAQLRHRGAAVAVAVVIFAAMPLLNPWNARDIYLGQITPNVWHNATLIYALPFSIAAFVAAVALLRRPSLAQALLCGVLIFASSAAKPNFTLALLPVLGLMVLWSMRTAHVRAVRQLGIIALAFLPGTVLLAYQYTNTFASTGLRQDTRLVFAPWDVWSIHSDNIALSLGLSVAGPLVVMCVLPGRRRLSIELVLAWSVFLVAMVQFVFLAESLDGKVLGSANFAWGTYAAMAMVFLACAISLGRAYLTARLTGRRRMLLGVAAFVLALHVATGLYYMGRVGVPGFDR